MWNRHNDDDVWIPLADLMTCMMLVFLLISVALIIKMRIVANSYRSQKSELYKDLYQEFKEDLPKWHASIDRDSLSIKFEDQNLLFDSGKAELKPKFVSILGNFFPRYIRILQKPKYRQSLSEIKIEGHTSSMWQGVKDKSEAYFLNMELSQMRTLATLEEVYNLKDSEHYHNFIKHYVTANGLSSSHPLYNQDGSENVKLSQRVEFKVELNAEQVLEKI